MPLDPIHAFYCRKEYLTLAQYCKIKSGGICARCGGVFDIDELRPHHITELTLDNIDDVNITLNPANIEVLCHDCHNAAHARFAEIIVLLVKEIGVTVLLTTHSANFMLALETMMRKYQIETKSNFYINRKKENGYMTSVECVNDCIDEIYTELVRPYAEMFELRRKITEPKE